MKKQVLVIHGGDTFASYDAYLNYLRSKQVSLERLLGKSWKDRLQEDLGNSFEVIAPKMPNPQNARYEEWKLWFEKITSLVNEEIILLGHSLGGMFLAKYLCENVLAKKIKAVLLVAAPFDEQCDLNLKEFAPLGSFSTFTKQAETIILYHSKDDPVVPFKELIKYQKALPSATVRVFENEQHFNLARFPKILEDLRKI